MQCTLLIKVFGGLKIGVLLVELNRLALCMHQNGLIIKMNLDKTQFTCLSRIKVYREREADSVLNW